MEFKPAGCSRERTVSANKFQAKIRGNFPNWIRVDYPTDNLAERITAAMKNRVKLYLEQISYVEAYWKNRILFRRKMGKKNELMWERVNNVFQFTKKINYDILDFLS